MERHPICSEFLSNDGFPITIVNLKKKNEVQRPRNHFSTSVDKQLKD